jgi:DNA-binding PadR family transcriptional regulator
MPSRRPNLTTTSYALLGLLAIKPWTAYELAQNMERGIARLWPRARSKIYEEPKKLVALGLARDSTETTGRRPRTVYSITPQGRRALAKWLAEPGSGPELEYEQLLKVFFSEHGSKKAVVATINDMRKWAEEQRAEHAEVAHSYFNREGRFQQRAAQLALTGRFLSDFAETVARWAEWAEGVVEKWPDDPASAEPEWASFEEIIRRVSVSATEGEVSPPRIQQ